MMNSPFGVAEFRKGTLAMVAEALGVSVERASQLVSRPDFPAPALSDQDEECWDLDDVASWNLMFGS